MTDRAGFSDTEWDLLVRLPKWVVLAASAAQDDGALATAAEQEVGLVAVAKGRERGNQFVTDIADQLTYTYDDADGPAIGPDFTDTTVGITGVLDRARSAAALLAMKADSADAAAYRGWLLTIADDVISAARSGGVLGIGADRVTDSERRFRDEFVHALQG